MSGDAKTIDVSPLLGNFNSIRDYIKFTFGSRSSFEYDKFLVSGHYEPVYEYPIANNNNVFKTRIKLNYNFLIRNFEEYIKDKDEAAIPEFYRILFGKILEEEAFKKFNGQSIFDRPEENLKESMLDSEQVRSLPFKFEKSISDELGFADLKTFLERFNSFKEQMPFYTEIKIDTHQINRENTFLEIVEKYNFFSQLVAKLQASEKKLKRIKTTTRQESNNSEADVSITEAVLEKSFFKEELALENPRDLSEMAASLNKLVETKRLSNLRQILRVQDCYSEVIGYKISKFDTKGANPTPISVMYVPNIDKQSIEIIDNRIKYDKEYIYVVSMLVFVICESISFRNNSVALEPVLKIFEVDSMSYANTLLDSPPIEPEVEILPFIGNDSRIKINLSTGIGTKDAIPVVFSPQEQQRYTKNKEAQERQEGDRKITFSSDESSDFFILYRLEKAPQTYRDFETADIRSIAKEFDSPAGSLDDNIKANKKYYYIFRSVDYHGNFSYPSPVYEVQIKNENGVILPEFKLYEFKSENLSSASKAFRRYLYVAPAFRQKMLNEQAGNAIRALNDRDLIKREVSLGTGTDSLWDRKFKIRLNSKSTGKSIDINVIFSINKD